MKTKSTSTFHRLIGVSFVILTGASSSHGTVIVSDNFNSYTAGGANLGGQGTVGLGWAGAWGSPSIFTADNTTAKINAYTGDNKLDIALSGSNASNFAGGRVLAAALTQTFYTTYTVQYTGSGFGGNNTIGLALSNNATTAPAAAAIPANELNFGMRSSATTTDFNYNLAASPEFFNVRAGSGGMTAALGYSDTATAGGVTAANINSGLAFQLVAKLTFNVGTNTFDRIDLWLNPTSGTETASDAFHSLASGSGIAAVNSIYFRQGGNDITGTPDSYRIDNLVLGTTWADVVPEPGTPTLCGIAALALLGVRRRSTAA